MEVGEGGIKWRAGGNEDDDEEGGATEAVAAIAEAARIEWGD